MKGIALTAPFSLAEGIRLPFFRDAGSTPLEMGRDDLCLTFPLPSCLPETDHSF